MSRFIVANELDDAVDRAFQDRPHRVDDEDGFLGMQVLRGLEDGKEFVLLTYWTDAACFERWHRGHRYKDSHKGVPRGLKLVRDSVRVGGYRYVTA